jgi:hypothetical protein
MPQLQNTNQNGPQTITLTGLAGAGLITVQFAFWVETPDAAAAQANFAFNWEAPNNIAVSSGGGNIFLGDATTDPTSTGQVVFFHAGASDPDLQITIASPGTATYAYQIDWQTH